MSLQPVDATWSDAPATSSTPDPVGAAAAGGRLTVLPRLEVEGDVPRLVQVERPRYEVVDRLGEGGLGEVVAARDLDIGRKVAIKTIRADRQSNAAFLRFVQEVRIVGQLDHPNIVPVHDVGRDAGGAYYFVMKCVDGETLEAILDRLKSGDRDTHAHWTFERRLAAFRGVLEAVRFAHDQGIVHRDLKPANVMIGRHGEVQLLDWGVARPLHGAELSATEEEGVPGEASDAARGRGSLSVTTTRVGALVGTPRYMSPEQARGERVDQRSDVWALSLLLYELLTLHHYLDGVEGLEAVLEAVQSRPIPHPKTLGSPHQLPVPAELMWFVMRGLQRDPARRFPSVAAMMESLDRRAEGEIEVHCPATMQKSMLVKATRFVDRHPLGLLWAAGATAILVVVGVVGLVVGAAALLIGAAGAAAALTL